MAIAALKKAALPLGAAPLTTDAQTVQVTKTARLLPALFCVSVLAIVWLAALGPFYPAVAKELSTPVALVGQIATVSMLVATVLGLIVGPLADQVGHRRILALGALAVAAGAFGSALAPVFVLLLLAALAGALGNAILSPVAVAIAGARFTGEARRGAISWVTAGGGIGVVVGVPLLTAIAARSSWRVALAALGAFAVAVTAVAWRAVPPDAARQGPRRAVSDLLVAYVPLLRDGSTLRLLGVSFMRNAGLWVFFTYYGAFLIQELHLGFAAVGWAYAGIGAGLFAGSRLAAGRIGKLPLRALVIWTTLLQAALTVGALLLPVGGVAIVAVLSVAMPLQGIYGVALTTLLLDGTPAGSATTMTVNQSTNNLGSALGSALGGMLLVAGGYHAIAIAVLVLMGSAAALVLPSRVSLLFPMLRIGERPAQP